MLSRFSRLKNYPCRRLIFTTGNFLNNGHFTASPTAEHISWEVIGTTAGYKMKLPQEIGLHDLRLLFNLPEKEVAKQIGESLSPDILITLTKVPDNVQVIITSVSFQTWQLKTYFGLFESGVCLTSLKKICRNHGLPYHHAEQHPCPLHFPV